MLQDAAFSPTQPPLASVGCDSRACTTQTGPFRAVAVGMTVLAGLAGGLAGGATMNLFSRMVSAATSGHEARGAAPGVDRSGRGVQPPQAAGLAEDDAPTRVGRTAHRLAAGIEPSRRVGLRLGTAAHYAFSASLGVAYALAVRRFPALRTCGGVAYGAAVWLVADEMVMPALGLSRSPQRLTPGIHAYALAGHLIYGATLDAASRELTRTRR